VLYPDTIERQLYKANKNTLLQNPKMTKISASCALSGKLYHDLDLRGEIRLEGADESMGTNTTAYRLD